MIYCGRLVIDSLTSPAWRINLVSTQHAGTVIHHSTTFVFVTKYTRRDIIGRDIACNVVYH